MTRLIRVLTVGVAVCALIGTSQAATFQSKQTATLRALDKITGRSTDIEMIVGDPIVFGSLKVDLLACYQTPPEEAPESAAFLKIHSIQSVATDSMDSAVAAKDVETVSEDNPLLFSGWMYASSPGLSALEHPVYDVWVIRCAIPDPVAFEEPEEDADPASDTPGEESLNNSEPVQ